MDLILWRHAEAEDGSPDLARTLTEKGHRQAQAMAGWLRSRLPDATRILVSPAQRTQQTIAPLDRPFHTVAEIAPGASAAAVLGAAGWPDGHDTVLVVGHQPTLGEVASLLICGSEVGMAIKKGAIVWLTSRRREGQPQVVLKAVLPAELV